MDAFVFQAGRRRATRRTRTPRDHARLPRRARRAGAARRGRSRRSRAHPCNAATATAAGFKVVTLPLEENGYPSLDALKAAVSDRTASLMVGNPDDMGDLQPRDRQVGRHRPRCGRALLLRPRQLQRRDGQAPGARARLRRMHVHAPQDVRRTQGRRRPRRRRVRLQRVSWRRSCPSRSSFATATATGSTTTGPTRSERFASSGATSRSSCKAYAWSRAMGADGIARAADISVLANNYMEKRLLEIRGVTKSHPHLTAPRLEMTRYSLEHDGTRDRHHRRRRPESDGRLRDRRVLAEPRAVARSPSRSRPKPASCGRRRTSTSGSTCSPTSSDEAYTDPEVVRTAPHNQAIHRLDPTDLNDPAEWATTWRAHVRKHGARESVGDPAGVAR